MLSTTREGFSSCTFRQEEQQTQGSSLPCVCKVDKPRCWVLWSGLKSTACCIRDKKRSWRCKVQPNSSQGKQSSKGSSWKVRLTAAISDNQVPAFLQMNGQQVSKGAGQVAQTITSFLCTLKWTEKSIPTAHLNQADTWTEQLCSQTFFHWGNLYSALVRKRNKDVLLRLRFFLYSSRRYKSRSGQCYLGGFAITNSVILVQRCCQCYMPRHRHPTGLFGESSHWAALGRLTEDKSRNIHSETANTSHMTSMCRSCQCLFRLL